MGKVSHLSPRHAFAELMNAYAWHLAQHQGWDRSGRQAEAALTELGAQKRSYWLKIFNNQQAMSTQDIATLAKFFGVSPYVYIDTAKEWDDIGRPSSGHLLGVGGQPEYERAARTREIEPTDET